MPSAPGMLCVQCRRRPVDDRYRPFCSERCKLIDLGKWAGGEYRIPGEPAEPDTPPEDGSPGTSGGPPA